MLHKVIQVLVIVWKSKRRPQGVALEWRKGTYVLNPLLHGTFNIGKWKFSILDIKYFFFLQGNSGWGGSNHRKCNSRQAKSRSDNPSLRILPQVICNGIPISTCREVGRGGYLDAQYLSVTERAKNARFNTVGFTKIQAVTNSEHTLTICRPLQMI